MTVRIPRGMAETVEGFLNTKQAASMGFDSKADFITAAVRHLLMEYGYYDALTKKIDKKKVFDSVQLIRSKRDNVVSFL